MHMPCDTSRVVGNGAFLTSRSRLESLVEVSSALAKLAPKGYSLSDEVRFENGSFKLQWIEARSEEALADADARAAGLAIREGLTRCQQRRIEANALNRAIPELPGDSKFLALNTALFEASQLESFLQIERGEPNPLPSYQPRALLLRVPQEEPTGVDVDAVVTGSNVVRGSIQPDLFEESVVDVIYFIQGGLFTQVRASVPLRLTHVKNLATYIRARCTRARPEDNFVTATELPHLYQVVNGAEPPHTDDEAA